MAGIQIHRFEASFAPPRIQDDVPELWPLVLGLDLLVVLVMLMTAIQASFAKLAKLPIFLVDRAFWEDAALRHGRTMRSESSMSTEG